MFAQNLKFKFPKPLFEAVFTHLRFCALDLGTRRDLRSILANKWPIDIEKEMMKQFVIEQTTRSETTTTAGPSIFPLIANVFVLVIIDFNDDDDNGGCWLFAF